MEHPWHETLAMERRGAAVMDAVFEPQFIIAKATRAHQRQGIDRFHICKKDGRIIYRVDYKTDWKAHQTRNIVLEHVSVRKGTERIKAGWVHTTVADLIVSYVPDDDTAYVMPIMEIRNAWPDIQTVFPLKRTSTPDRNGGYYTDFYAVPIEWLKRNRIITKEIKAVGCQLRLW